ncbi:MAG TPA: ABC transporter substrate-binding protein [Casimicrobiaceae bacterium]|jgi:putative ABC transport system substrate-binding protein
MKRRDAILALVALGLAAASFCMAAQPKRPDPARVAILDDATEATRQQLWAAFRNRLRELGHVEGRDVLIEAHFAGGNPDRLRSLAAELVAVKPDVLVVVTTTVAVAVKKATSTIPIVALGPTDPVKSGLVASLARPGGNLTGLSPNQGEIVGKWLELLRALRPSAKTLVYLTDTANPGEMLVYRDLEQRARSVGLESQVMDGINAANVDQAFASMQTRRTDALVVATTASLLTQRRQIVDGAARLRIPAIYARQEYPEAGGLISYGSDSQALFARAADYVNRILRGTPPSELPFEMASTFRLVLNLRTSRAFGLAIPQAIRIRADEVIE